MKFRYDIGALRAIAVLIVVFFHYQIPFFNGGFIGVDIFFVISGYLMTRIVLEGFEKSKFSLVDFYRRRFIRIVPTLLVVLLGVLICTYFWYFPVDFKQAAIYSGFSSIFLSNVYYLLHSGYFDASSQFNILLHTWSLSVEWQFYLIYPVLLMLVKKWYLKKRNLFNVVFFTTTLLSFLLVIWFNNFLPTHYGRVSFFFVTHRAWEMMIGGIAFLFASNFEKVSKQLRISLSAISFALLIFCTITYNEHGAWPSTLTVVPVLASFFIVAFNSDIKIYRNSIIQYFGNVSYSLYLWHWPVYVFFKYRDIHFMGESVVFFLISFVLAVLTYRYVESKSRAFSVKKIAVATLGVVGITLLGVFGNVNGWRYSKEIIDLSEYNEHYEETRKKQFNSGVCHHVSKIHYVDCLCTSKEKKNILLLGDSHAGQLSLSFRKQLDTTKFQFLEHTVVGAFPLVNSIGDREASEQFHEIFETFIVKNLTGKDDKIILSANWSNYPARGYDSKDRLLSSIEATVSYLKDLGLDVVILGQSEEYNLDFPKCLAFNLMDDEDRDYIKGDSKELNVFLKSNLGDEYLDIFLHPNIIHHDTVNNVPYMFDDNHMSLYGADQLVSNIISMGILDRHN